MIQSPKKDGMIATSALGGEARVIQQRCANCNAQCMDVTLATIARGQEDASKLEARANQCHEQVIRYADYIDDLKQMWLIKW